MSAKFFLDTNIIIYTFAKTAAGKQKKAKSLVKNALAGSGCISWQVIQEFCNIVAAAVEAGARILYSEDLQHNRKYRSLTIENPFGSTD